MTENSDQKLIDFDHLEKYVGGDDPLRDEILTIFIDQVEMLLERFDVDADDETWHDAAHALKGAARGVGAFGLGDLAEEAETIAGDEPGKGEAREAKLLSIREMGRKVIGVAMAKRG